MKTKKNAQRIAKHDPMETRLDRINRSLKHGLQLRRDGLWIEFQGRLVHLAVPADIQQQVWASLAGRGETLAAMARRLSDYGLSEWERRFCNVYAEDEPDADRLTEPTDHTWKVV